MNDTVVIYKILRALSKYMDVPEPDYKDIQPKRLEISRVRWERILYLLVKEGLIEGVVFDQSALDPEPVLCEPMYPRITLKGIDYLENSGMMAKAKEFLKTIVPVAGAMIK